MSILFLFPYPIATAASQRFRFEQYFPLLTSKGIHFKSQSFWDVKAWKILYEPGKQIPKFSGFIRGIWRRLTLITSLHKFDFVFIHRECSPLGPPIIEWMIAKIFRKKIIYDFDDAIWLPNTSRENKLISIIKNHRKAVAICRWSYKVSCGNAYLAEFARQSNIHVVINPTTIDTEFHNPKSYPTQRRTDLITIGWTGSHSTLHYLNILLPVFKRLEDKFSGQWKLLIIADKDPEWTMKYAEFKFWSKETEIKDLLQFDIGIMPLSEDPWSKGKCGFKALQYLAMEIPAVASPVGVNNSIITAGVEGYLCKEETEWFEAFEKLFFDKSLREKLGVQGRLKVIDQYSLCSNSPSFLGLFS